MTFQPAPTILSRRLGGEWVLVELASGELFTLNETAGCLWEALLAGGSVEDAVRTLVQRFEVDDAAALAEAEAMIQRLIDLGCLAPNVLG